LATNIGIHFFDLLIWLFGPVDRAEVHLADAARTGGYIELERARVNWFLSIDDRDLPEAAVREGKRTYRSITIDDEEVEFSGGFTDLHTVVYQDILGGGGFGLEDARPSIVLAHNIRNAVPTGIPDKSHPFMLKRK
jgi:UDP-N-acetyl-2-amino-2-deoxyglucuronate dehydrogenase